MNRTEMLEKMCREVLTQADIKAICKSRGLAAQAASSRRLFESLFLSDSGVAAALGRLDRKEVALLHLLKALDSPVNVTFFHRLYGTKQERSYGGTFAQLYQGTLTKTKERLVRSGLLILAAGPETWERTTKMERWQFALPAQVAAQLPPLLESTRTLHSTGDCCRHMARDKLKSIFGNSRSPETKADALEIVDGELQMGGHRFTVCRLLAWQKELWRADTAPAKQGKGPGPHTLLPSEAAAQILGGLAAGEWSNADGLAAPLAMFCGCAVDSSSVCESGWRWGCLAKQEVDGKVWYRPAPQLPAEDVPPDSFLNVTADGHVTVDLDTVPYATLERLVALTNQLAGRGNRPVLLITPDLIKLGRASEDVWALPLIAWLEQHSPAFRQAAETCRERRGKTILHENLSLARVSDLALRVAIEKALGSRVVALGEDFVAFPNDVLSDVRKIVTKSGYVIKEVAHCEP